MAGREVVVDFEFLRGRQNDTVVKELSVDSANAVKKFRFKRPYKMADHGTSENVLNWAEGHKNIKYCTLSSLRPWPLTHTFTPTASQNVQSSPD